METVSKKELNLRNAKKLKLETYESDIFVKDGNLYKMYKKLRFYPFQIDNLKNKETKVEILSDCPIKELITAKRIVKSRKIIDGLEQDYLENARTLYDFARYSRSVAKYIATVLNSSFTLREIHDDPRDIVVCDLNFDNIMFDPDFNTYYVDSDSYAVDGLPSSSIGKSLAIYCHNRSIRPSRAYTKYDTFQLFVNFLQILFGKYIEHITIEEYDELSEQISTLKNMREYFIKTLNSVNVPTVPYVDELVDRKDLIKNIDYKMPIL